MACDLTAGIAQRCKDSLGGIKKVYMFNYLEDAFTISNSVVTALSASLTQVYEFFIEGDTNTLTQNLVSDRNTKTSVNTQTLTINFGKQDATTTAQGNLLAYGYHMAVVVDRNDVYHAIGIDDGIDFTIDANTGGAKTDLNGYTMTGVSTTGALAPQLDASSITALLALV